MEYTYYEVTPGGNTTALLFGIFSPKEKQKINKKILSQNSLIEQVGFVVPAQGKNADARLEMAGGELCGNALRSVGALLAKQTGKKNFLIETDVTTEPISVLVRLNESTVCIPAKLFQLDRKICSLPGISHILERNNGYFPNAKQFLEKKNLLKKKAVGIMSYETKNGKKLRLFPTVWVRDIKTCLKETACASGTLALAWYLYSQSGNKKFSIQQPSNAVFTVLIKRKYVYLRGPVWTIKKNSLNF